MVGKGGGDGCRVKRRAVKEKAEEKSPSLAGTRERDELLDTEL
jgi:hypothetical protein